MKLNKHAWVLWGIALAAVLLLSLMIPFIKTAVYWLAFLCTLAMFGVIAAAFARSFRKEESLESKLLGWPIFKVAYIALIAQIILGFTLMALSPLCPIFAAVILEVMLFAATAFGLTVKDAAREIVTASESKVIDTTGTWKAIRARAASITAGSDHALLKELAEDIRYADPTPTSMDGEIAQMVEKIGVDPSDENIRKALQMVAQRKALSKEEKK